MEKLIKKIKNMFNKKNNADIIEEEIRMENKCNTCSNNIDDNTCLKGISMPKVYCNHYNEKDNNRRIY